MFGRIGERGMGRSGWSLSWLAVYCQLLISHTAPANALFNIHLGKFYDSHISICLSAAHTPTPQLHSPQSQPVLSAAGGLLGRTQSSASRSPSLQAPGLGRGKSKPAWLLPSSLRSPQISLTAGLSLRTDQGEGITLSFPRSKQDNKCLSYLREPWENACAGPEGGKNGGERAAASQPLLLINHQKSLPWFMAFDPSSSFALRGRELGGKGEGEQGEGHSFNSNPGGKATSCYFILSPIQQEPNCGKELSEGAVELQQADLGKRKFARQEKPGWAGQLRFPSALSSSEAKLILRLRPLLYNASSIVLFDLWASQSSHEVPYPSISPLSLAPTGRAQSRRWRVPFEVVLEATAFSLMSLRADEPLVATMVSTLFFFSAAELAWDWVSMAIAHSSTPHGDGITGGGGEEGGEDR
eukprot:superscaffoldBa00000780_g7170